MDKTNAEENIEVLEKMNELAVNPPKDVIEAKANESSPLESVERDLAKFTQDNFSLLMSQSEWVKEIQAELRGRFGLSEKDGGLSANQLIALLTNESVNLNDRVSKLLGPTFQLMTARQQAEYAARNAEMKNPNITINNGSVSGQGIKQLNEDLDREEAQKVLQGMTALANLNSLFSNVHKAEVEDKNKS